MAAGCCSPASCYGAFLESASWLGHSEPGSGSEGTNAGKTVHDYLAVPQSVVFLHILFVHGALDLQGNAMPLRTYLCHTCEF